MAFIDSVMPYPSLSDQRLKKINTSWGRGSQSNANIGIPQKKYALSILEKTDMLECKPINASMDSNVKILPRYGQLYQTETERYQRLGGHHHDRSFLLLYGSTT